LLALDILERQRKRKEAFEYRLDGAYRIIKSAELGELYISLSKQWMVFPLCLQLHCKALSKVHLLDMPIYKKQIDLFLRGKTTGGKDWQ
jgi:hypothetical protein